MGVTVSDAVRVLLTRVAAEKALPFEVKAPNATTAAAIEEARDGGLPSFRNVSDLTADLNAEDGADLGPFCVTSGAKNAGTIAAISKRC
jgi:DNA-damage-inducible protein J